MRQTIILLCVILFLGVCWDYIFNPNYEKIFRENKLYFAAHKEDLKNVILDIEQTNLKTWDRQKMLQLPIDSLSESTRNTLEDLGIANIECFGSSNSSCHKNYSLSFNVVNKWHVFRLKVVQLCYHPCDKRTDKNYHYYDGYHQDIWGLGDDYYIYSDTDMF